MSRRAQRRKGDLLSRTVRLSVRDGRLLETSETVAQDVLVERLGWLCTLVKERAQRRIAASWTKRALEAWRQPGLPVHAWKALDVIKGPFKGPRRLTSDSRLGRIADELAGRTLRSALGRIEIAETLLETWVSDANWKLLDKEGREAVWARRRELLPAGATSVEIRSVRRAINNYLRRQGQLPKDALSLYPAPELRSLVAPLSAADSQFVRIAGDRLEVRLPLRAHPRHSKDWAFHSLPYDLPAWAQGRYPEEAKARLPLLRMTKKGAELHLPVEFASPPKRLLARPVLGLAQVRAFALDWGLRRLLTGVIIEPDAQDGRVRSDGRPFFFQAAHLQTHLYELRGQAERLAAKIERQERLLAGVGSAAEEDPLLRASHERLLAEKSRRWAHLTRVNEQLACAAARWAYETAKAEDCNLLVLEDLSDMEARKLGRTVNGRCALQVRGLLLERLDNLAQAGGLSLLVVEPRGTSSQCSRCGERSHFQHAPDLKEGRNGKRHANWLHCACGRSSDRDHSAAERIGARGLQLATIEPRVKSVKAQRRQLRTRSKSEPTPRVRLRARRRTRLPQPSSIKSLSAQRPRGVGSPSSVDRGVRVGYIKQRAVSRLSSVSLASTRVCDGLLGGYRKRLVFTRVNALAASSPRREIEVS